MDVVQHDESSLCQLSTTAVPSPLRPESWGWRSRGDYPLLISSASFSPDGWSPPWVCEWHAVA